MNKLAQAVLSRIILYPLVIGILLSLYFFIVYVFPKRIISPASPKQLMLEYQDVTLTTKDGLKLAGWFIPHQNSKKAIIVCHGYPADKGDVLGVSEFLARDYNLLYFDFRALGKSQGRLSTFGWREREDFWAAVRFLKTKGFNDIGAFGFSMGAAVIFLANSPQIKCVVSDSAYARLEDVILVIFKNYGPLRYPMLALMKLWSKVFLQVNLNAVAPVEYIAKMKTPILLIHCPKDTLVPVSEALMLQSANPRAELMLTAEGGHGESSYSNDYEKRILKFFRDNL